MRAKWLTILLVMGCKGIETGVTAQKRALSTSQATFDAGMVAVDDRETLNIFVASTGQGDVTISDIYVEDEEHWTVSATWQTDDSDEDGIFDSLTVPGATEDDPAYGLIEVIFKPVAEEEYRTTLTIVSNDSEVTERTDEDLGIWRVVLRGIGRYPCAEVWPDVIDFGNKAAGGYYAETAYVTNCGYVTLTVTDFEDLDETGADSASFYVGTQAPVYVLPGQSEPIELSFQPSGGAEGALVIPQNNDPYFDDGWDVFGNDCENSVHPEWDADSDGWFSCGGDCDDTDYSQNPTAQEKESNGEDDDCDGKVDEGTNNTAKDGDGDGQTEQEGDCDDKDAEVYTGATEVINQVDDDCDGKVDNHTEWYDDDGDGLSEREGDCNDDDFNVVPGGKETQNDVDDDCDGYIDEGTFVFDDDGDGYAELDPVNPDCNDGDPWTFPGAIEDCDGRDNDCDTKIDEGANNEPDGACTFLVARKASNDEPKKGCAAVGAAGMGSTGLLALFALAGRRRDPTPG